MSPEAQESLAKRLLAGDKRALARAITLVESDDPAGWELVREVFPHTGKAAIVGLTGAPGAGKSTLIGALTKARRAQERVVAVLMPGSGDSIQALKAGVMEIPDIIVVNKADHPLTDTMVREVRGVLSLGPQQGWRVPIVKTEAARGEGVEALLTKLDEHRAYIEAEGTLLERRRRNLLNEVLALATARLRRQLKASIHEDP